MSNDMSRLRSSRQEPTVTDIIPERSGFSNARNKAPNGIRSIRRYVNYSSVMLSIMTRDGLKMVLKPSNPDLGADGEYQRPVVKVFIEYHFNSHLLDSVVVPFSEDAGKELGRDAALIFDILHRERGIAFNRSNPTNPIILSFEYTIDPNIVRENGGSIYIESLDLLICEEDGRSRLHPYSAMGKIDREITEMNHATSGFMFGITIVDNANRVGKLYTRYAGNVFAIRAIRDTNRKDGVYLSLKNVASGDDPNKGYQTDGQDYYSPDDPGIQDVLNLWKTYNEAVNCEGVRDTVARENRMAEEEAKHKNTMAAKEIDKQLLELKMAHANKQAENVDRQAKRDEEKFHRDAQTDAEKSQAELENQNQKKKYDRENHDMAMQREWIRFVGPAVASIAAIVTTVLTIMQMKVKQQQIVSMLSAIPSILPRFLRLFA